jgi:hypothetical protein
MTATLTEQRSRLRRILGQIDLDEQLRKRAAQQAIVSAEAWFWCWRAEQFDWASRPDIALACRRKAAFLEWEAGGPLVDPVTGEVA